MKNEIHQIVFPVYLEIEEIAIKHNFGMDQNDEDGREIWLMARVIEDTSINDIKVFLKTVDSFRNRPDWEVSDYTVIGNVMTAVFKMIKP